jgi:hypothetical protein
METRAAQPHVVAHKRQPCKKPRKDAEDALPIHFKATSSPSAQVSYRFPSYLFINHNWYVAADQYLWRAQALVMRIFAEARPLQQ